MSGNLLILQGYLSEDAVAAVNELLPDSAEGDLAAVCFWPDEVRFHYRWSSALRYIDTANFKYNLIEALIFLAHFIGMSITIRSAPLADTT
ncbi:hypothetical protein GH714_018264 [Hevea brasiliensis]|uniref:Aspergillus nuclease S1 n=1 Tax=Hevea brasiliensis TaxID=3981 RepID=A0A6A6LUZ0_HEVBR|nr:hypothetical protein GH714_018264 [Hevea brasiliensis]